MIRSECTAASLFWVQSIGFCAEVRGGGYLPEPEGFEVVFSAGYPPPWGLRSGLIRSSVCVSVGPACLSTAVFLPCRKAGSNDRGVAQSGSAHVWGTCGRWFESSHPDHPPWFRRWNERGFYFLAAFWLIAMPSTEHFWIQGATKPSP